MTRGRSDLSLKAGRKNEKRIAHLYGPSWVINTVLIGGGAGESVEKLLFCRLSQKWNAQMQTVSAEQK